MRTMHPIHARYRRLRVLFAVLAAALFLQACGQDPATESSDASSAAAEQESDASSAAAEQESAAPADSGDDTAEEEGGDDVAGVDLSGDFCTVYNQFNDSEVLNQEPETAKDFAKATEQLKQIYRALADKAPPEIAEDVQFVTETGIRQIDLANELVREAGGKPAQVLDDPEAAQQLDKVDADGELPQTAERLDTWTSENC